MAELTRCNYCGGDLTALVETLNAISEGRESRIAHVYKRCREAASAIAAAMRAKP